MCVSGGEGSGEMCVGGGEGIGKKCMVAERGVERCVRVVRRREGRVMSMFCGKLEATGSSVR